MEDSSQNFTGLRANVLETIDSDAYRLSASPASRSDGYWLAAQYTHSLTELRSCLPRPSRLALWRLGSASLTLPIRKALEHGDGPQLVALIEGSGSDS